jgi:hypothetical protein
MRAATGETETAKTILKWQTSCHSFQHIVWKLPVLPIASGQHKKADRNRASAHRQQYDAAAVIAQS